MCGLVTNLRSSHDEIKPNWTFLSLNRLEAALAIQI